MTTIRKDLVEGISSHLVGEGFEVPNAPSFGAELEREYITKMKEIRSRAFDANGNKYTDQAHAQAVADYENERHSLSEKYAFVPYTIARELHKQCHRGMGFDDLFNVGFAAILHSIDKWPPFLGATDKGYRFLTTAKTAVHNAICRFLDDNNRPVKIPAFKIEQISVKLKAANLLYGKKKQVSKCRCANCPCDKLHTDGCGRKKPGVHEQDILTFLRKAELTVEDVDGKKSLGDLAVDTNDYKSIAEIVNLDVSSFISIIQPTSSIDVPMGDESDDTIADTVIAESYDSDKQAFTREIIEKALTYIPERNANIIRDHYFKGFSIQEIAYQNKYSVTRANQMIKKSVNRIMASGAAMNILGHILMGKNSD